MVELFCILMAGLSLMCPGREAEADAVWFEGGGVTYNPDEERCEVVENSIVTVNIVADFAVHSMQIYAIRVDNPDVDNQGVYAVGELNSHLCYGALVSAGLLENGTFANIVISEIAGSVSIDHPGPAPAGEALYSLQLQTGEAGTWITVDDFKPSGYPGPYCIPEACPGSRFNGNAGLSDIVELNVYVVSECSCMGDMTGDGWLSPSDVSDLMSELLPHASSHYWVRASAGSCGDMNADGWLSPVDISLLIGKLLPYKTNHYTVSCGSIW
jgi:hypothetical protein